MASRIVIRVNDEDTEENESGVDIYNLIKYARSIKALRSITSDRKTGEYRVAAKVNVISRWSSNW